MYQIGPINQRGQGILEYTLLLVILVAIIFGLMAKFRDPFGKYSKTIVQSRLECALEKGVLMDSPEIREEGGVCAEAFQASGQETNYSRGGSGSGGGRGSTGPSSGRSSGSSVPGSTSGSSSGGNPNDKNGNSSNGKNANSNQDNNSANGTDSNTGASGSGEGGAGGDDNAGGGRGGGGAQYSNPTPKANNIFGRNGQLVKSTGIGAADGATSEVTINTEEGDDAGYSNYSSFRRNRRKPRSVAQTGSISKQDVRKKVDRDNAVTTKVDKPMNEGSERKPKQVTFKDTRNDRIQESKDEGWSIGQWLRIAIIVLIILAILIFLFFQVMQFARSFDKK